MAQPRRTKNNGVGGGAAVVDKFYVFLGDGVLGVLKCWGVLVVLVVLLLLVV